MGNIRQIVCHNLSFFAGGIPGQAKLGYGFINFILQVGKNILLTCQKGFLSQVDLLQILSQFIYTIDQMFMVLVLHH